jgi:hypothetical protein
MGTGGRGDTNGHWRAGRHEWALAGEETRTRYNEKPRRKQLLNNERLMSGQHGKTGKLSEILVMKCFDVKIISTIRYATQHNVSDYVFLSSSNY